MRRSKLIISVIIALAVVFVISLDSVYCRQVEAAEKTDAEPQKGDSVQKTSDANEHEEKALEEPTATAPDFLGAGAHREYRELSRSISTPRRARRVSEAARSARSRTARGRCRARRTRDGARALWAPARRVRPTREAQ